MSALPPYSSSLQIFWYYAFRVICGLIFFFLIFPILVIMPLSFNAEDFFTFTPKMLAFDPDGGGEEEGGAGGSVPPVTIPEPPRNPASRTGDLWILGDHRLLCGDSTSAADVRRLMNGERAILFATDPPYLVDYDGSNHPTRNKDWSASYGTTWDDSSQGAELYDGFTFNCLSWLEALGFCGIGEAKDFLDGGGAIARNGVIPLNTHGGQLSHGRTHGMGLIHEAVAQLRGDAGPRQVDDAQVAVVSSGGLTPSGVMLLRTEA